MRQLEVAMRRRIVLVAQIDDHWAALVGALDLEDLEIDVLPPRTSAADVVACAARAPAVVIVDLAPDPSLGPAIAAACRAAGVGPVVAVAENPSADLARRVRLAGAFYLALRPIDLDEMRTILASAFHSLERQRTGASSCRDTRRILIVDDDPDFVASATALLEACGYAVSHAPNGREGLAMARAEHPDLIVLDVMMEHDNAGYELTQAVKFASGGEDLRQIPILMVSSIEVSPDARFAMADDAPLITPNAYLTKPLDIGRFLAEVGALLGEPAPRLTGARP
jgi:twitching motility two-component system response regulator PilH